MVLTAAKPPQEDVSEDAAATQAISAEADRLCISMPDWSWRLMALGSVGLLLSVLTLGLARFWYVTALRRFFWSRTRIGRFPLVYHGTASELFLGLVVALWVLVPVYTVLLLVLVGFGRSHWALEGSVAVFLIFLTQVALYRARRYRLTRTVWRGVRFDQTGSALHYGLIWVLGLLLTLVSLGLALPIMRQMLHRYRVNHTVYGGHMAHFKGPLGPLLGAYGQLYGPLVLFLIGLGAVYWSSLSDAPHLAATIDLSLQRGFAALSQTQQVLLRDWIWLCIWFVLGSTALISVLGPRYFTFEFRHFVAHSTLQDMGLSSNLGVRDLLKIWIRFAAALGLVICVMGGLFWVVVVILGLPYSVIWLSDVEPLDWLILLAGFYGLCLYAFLLCHLLYLRYPVWRAKAQSIQIDGAQTLDKGDWPTRPGQRGGLLAEGVTDALGVGGL